MFRRTPKSPPTLTAAEAHAIAAHVADAVLAHLAEIPLAQEIVASAQSVTARLLERFDSIDPPGASNTTLLARINAVDSRLSQTDERARQILGSLDELRDELRKSRESGEALLWRLLEPS